MSIRLTILTALALSLFPVAGCGGDEKIEVVDIDKVLAIFDEVSKTKIPTGEPETPADPPDPLAPEAGGVEPIDKPDSNTTAAFLKAFAAKLNEAKLISDPIGVHLLSTGGIEGFRDKNKDAHKGSREERLFTLQIDPENKRVIATQVVAKETYRRDHYYHRHHYHGGYWGYWMMGSMWGNQRSYYRDRPRSRPNFSTMKMSSPGVHARATSKARSASRSARSRGGSRGFRGGK